MKLRLTGTDTECQAAVAALAAGFEIREVSGFYPNRGTSLLGRVYVAAEPWRMNPQDGPPAGVIAPPAGELELPSDEPRGARS